MKLPWELPGILSKVWPALLAYTGTPSFFVTTDFFTSVSSSGCTPVSDGGSAHSHSWLILWSLHLCSTGISLPALSLFFFATLWSILAQFPLSINHFCKLSHFLWSKETTQLHALLCTDWMTHVQWPGARHVCHVASDLGLKSEPLRLVSYPSTVRILQ